MSKNHEFVLEHYGEQIDAFNSFIEDAYTYLPENDHSLIRFGGGTALAIYYFQHRLSFDIDLFVTDVQMLNYLSPKHWIEETSNFADRYIDLSNHIRVLHKKNNIKIDILVTDKVSNNNLIDSTNSIFNKTIYIESIEEIIAKKIVYRRKDNLTRDIIDIAISIKHGNNTLKRLFDEEMINLKDIEELYQALLSLDIDTYSEELEIVAPFEKYLEDAQNAPEIIKVVCKNILEL